MRGQIFSLKAISGRFATFLYSNYDVLFCNLPWNFRKVVKSNLQKYLLNLAWVFVISIVLVTLGRHNERLSIWI